MSDFALPTRTAGELTLPGGDTVWICQLNTLLHEEADTKARWHAQCEARRYLKGGRDYPEVLAYVKGMAVAEQAAYVAKMEYWTLTRETDEKYPVPERPEQGEQTPEAFTKAAVEWEAACAKVREKHEKEVQRRWDAEIKRNTALTVGVRTDRCCTAFLQEQWGAAFVKRREMETMWRAVRTADDHTRRYFASPEAYEDADDAVQVALRDFFYKTLAEPPISAIPISAGD